MRRIAFLLGTLLVLPAFAEVVPQYYYADATEYADAEFDGDDVYENEDVATEEQVAAPNVVASPAAVRNARNTTGRATVSRAVPSNASAVRTTSSRTTTARTTTNGGVQARTAVTSRAATNNTATRANATRGTASRASVSRAATTNQNVSAARSATTTTQQPAAANTARVGVTSTVAPAIRVTGNSTSIVQPDTVQTPLYTGRVSTRTSAIGARVPTIRMASASSASEPVTVSAADVTQSMDELAQLTDFCKAQYMECMDNFCNVLDDNQGRCSCSPNIDNYAKTEAALKQATEDLQEVAQKIQYIGLSSEEIETLFTQTEAELTMQGTTDSSQLKNSLDKVKKMLVDVKGGNASASTLSGLSMDLSGLLDFSIDSMGFDLSSFLNTGNNNVSSISNQRGKQLYDTAVKRCKAAVLNTCSQQGVDTSVIVNSYDLEIDKQCILYERALTDANDQMVATVRNAKSVLQKARLMVAQQKNEYDLRGCISALDSCMQDDYVCGSDYENCLDPTGKYIVNGEIVVGSTPGYHVDEDNPGDGKTNVPNSSDSTDGLYATWKYNSNKSAWNNSEDGGNLAEYINTNMLKNSSGYTKSDTNMVKYLMQKIGYHDDGTGRDYGMCASVLNRCQNYTYEKTNGKTNGKYKFENDVVREYLTRALVQIKTAQDAMIASYAEDCITEVQSCISTNNGYYSGSSTSTNLNIAINACKAQITTCMSVNGNLHKTPTPDTMLKWVQGILGVANEVEVASSDVAQATCAALTSQADCTSRSITCKNATTGLSVSGVECVWSDVSKACSLTSTNKSKCDKAFAD